jgi:5-hydroxyisourate hydrolase
LNVASLSTHVLDAAAGGPCPGVTVTVADAEGTTVAAGLTGLDGRCADLAAGLPVGVYRIGWRTDGVFIQEVSVTVHLGEERHYHVPLLASPVSAVTYLGG